MPDPDTTTREEEFQRNREWAAESSALENAFASGAQHGAGGGDLRFIDLLGDPDIEREDIEDDLSDEVAAMLSRVHMLGNIPDEEYKERRELLANKADRLKAEHPNQAGAGSKCVGEFREILLGEREERTPLSPELARRYDEATEVRGSMESLAREAKAFDGLTQMQAVAMTESDAGGSSSSGGSTLSRAASILPGR